jgi:hypothetical protein
LGEAAARAGAEFGAFPVCVRDSHGRSEVGPGCRFRCLLGVRARRLQRSASNPAGHAARGLSPEPVGAQNAALRRIRSRVLGPRIPCLENPEPHR